MSSSGPPSNGLWIVVAGVVLCAALVWIGLTWPHLAGAHQAGGPELLKELTSDGREPVVPFATPFLELLKLVAAASIGMVVTNLHKQFHRDRPISRAVEQSQILLCVSGALMMIIIGNSLARALGIAGGASIVRFRTPVEDPKDATILFLLLGLGMSCGLGAYAVAGLGTLFLCLMLMILDKMGERKQRIMMLEMIASGPNFPAEHVRNVLAGLVNFYEPRDVSQDVDEVKMRYQVSLDPSASLAYLTSMLVGNGSSGLKSVTWEVPKKSDQVAAG